jgi:hypothetical protein
MLLYRNPGRQQALRSQEASLSAYLHAIALKGIPAEAMTRHRMGVEGNGDTTTGE